MEAAQRAQARALHLGEMLLEVRQQLGKAEWEFWLEYGCPIPAGAARRYANEAKRLKQAAPNSLQVHTTERGGRYVKVSEILRSEAAKRQMEAVRGFSRKSDEQAKQDA